MVCSTVQAAGNGVRLTQPHPETDIIPCEMTFRAHPNASQFCVTNIVVVSEARNVELYVDDMYEKTTKGMMLTLKKGKLVFYFFHLLYKKPVTTSLTMDKAAQFIQFI